LHKALRKIAFFHLLQLINSFSSF